MPWTMASVAVHATLIASAIALTLRDGTSKTSAVRPLPPVLYVDAMVGEARTASLPSGPTLAASPDLLPITVPNIPSFDLTQPAQTIAPSEIFGTFASSWPASTRPALPTGGVYKERLVDRAAAPRTDNGSPPYPLSLRSAGLEGDVRVRFIVDTVGRVEPASIEILQATHPLFGSAVATWLLRTRYSPAEVAGRFVRQLVEQRVSFTLTR